MLYFTANPRDGISGAAGASCNLCCCQNIKLRPGETNLLRINYAPWSLPLGWVVPTLEFDIVQNDEACSTAPINGQNPPNNSFYLNQTTPQEVPLVINLRANEFPVGGSFTYSIVPFTGAHNGTLSNNDGVVTYTPRNAFQGWDYFWYEMKDAQGRTVQRSVLIRVGTAAAGPIPFQATTLGPHIDLSKVKTDTDGQIVSIPIYMGYDCNDCTTWRLTIKQPASDCDKNLFHHFACFDIRCGDC